MVRRAPSTIGLKCNPAVGSLPVLQYCSPAQLQVDPAYQRSLETASSQALIRRIAQHWDWGLCQPLIVARRADDCLYVVDGQHRHAAAVMRGDIWQLPCVVSHFASMEAEAASFVALNQQRRPLSSLDLFKAALASGDKEAVEVVAALEAAGLSLAATTNNHNARPGSVANTGGMLRILREHGADRLRVALRCLAAAWPDEIMRFAGTIFPGIAAVVAHEMRLRHPADQLVAEFGALLGARSQSDWYTEMLKAISLDPNLNRRRAAEKVVSSAWLQREFVGSRHEPQVAKRTEPVRLVDRAPVVKVARPQPAGDSTMLPAETAWCDQCDQRVSGARVARCSDQFCSLRRKAVGQ